MKSAYIFVQCVKMWIVNYECFIYVRGKKKGKKKRAFTRDRWDRTYANDGRVGWTCTFIEE